MNTTIRPLILLLLVIFFISSCSTQKREMEMPEEKIFKTPEEAAKDAQNILIQILETYKDLKLDIDLRKLRESELASLIQYVLIDFEKILSSESVVGLSKIVASEKSVIAPFILNDEIVGIVEVAKTPDGWKVSGLGNKVIREDLNQSRIVLLKNAIVTLYEVPNLHIMIYEVKENSEEMYFLKFENFTMKEGVNVEAFYSLLRQKAIQFDKDFGEQLKKEKLLK